MKSRHAAKEMLQKKPEGTYIWPSSRDGIYYLQFTDDTGKIVRKSLGTRSRRLADIARTEFLATRELNLDLRTVAGWLQWYSQYRGTKVSDSTWRNVDKWKIPVLRKWFEEQGVKWLRQITTQTISEYLMDLEAQKRSGATRKSAYEYLKAMLKIAAERGYCEGNPCEDVAPRLYRPGKTTKRALQEREIEPLLRRAEAEGPAFLGAIATSIYAGLRARELEYLEWDDVTDKYIMIRQKQEKGFTIKDHEERQIPLHPKLAAILKPMRQDEGYCFVAAMGGRLTWTVLYHRFKNCIAKEALTNTKGLTLHSLRRGFGTIALLHGVNLYTISKWYGHSSISVTERYLQVEQRDHTAEMAKWK